MDIRAYEQSLAELVQKAHITDVIHAYCLHFDRAEAESVLDLFVEEASVDYGPDVPTMTGLAEIRPMITKGLTEFFAATSHHISNITIHFSTPERANSQCYVYAWHRYHDGRPNSELWGQYFHSFQRTENGWKISELILKAAGTENFHRDRMHHIGRREYPAST